VAEEPKPRGFGERSDGFAIPLPEPAKDHLLK